MDRRGRLEGGVDRQYLLAGIGVLAVLFLVLFFVGEADESAKAEAEEAAAREADAYAGGFPVPPMPAGGPVRGAAKPLVFERSAPVTAPPSATSDEEI